MNEKDLLDLLDLAELDEINYFDPFAALIECEKEIPFELFYSVLSYINKRTLADLIDSYFEDVLQGIPDEHVDLYTQFSTIKQSLLFHLKSRGKDSWTLFVEELFRFRTWYVFDCLIACVRLKDGEQTTVSVSEALALSRLEKLNEDRYNYDFFNCTDYPLEEYSMPIEPDVEDLDEEDDEFDEFNEFDEDDEEMDDLYEEGLIHRHSPVIDGETYDQGDGESEEDEKMEFNGYW